MPNKIVKITETRVVTTLPDGTYKGKWGGNIIDVYVNPISYRLETQHGVRGFNIPVTVNVKEGVATFVEIKQD